MFKRSLMILLVLFAAAVCYAQTSDQPADNAQAGLIEQNKQINGKIDKIDHEKMTLSIKDETTKDKHDFSFSPSTTFSKDGQTVTVKDLKKGDRVMLEVDSANMILKADVTPKESTPTEKQEKKDSEKPE